VWGILYSSLQKLQVDTSSSSILVEMRTALHASQALSQNLSMTLPAGYTPLSLAEGFYLATLGGAEGLVNHVHC